MKLMPMIAAMLFLAGCMSKTCDRTIHCVSIIYRIKGHNIQIEGKVIEKETRQTLFFVQNGALEAKIYNKNQAYGSDVTWYTVAIKAPNKAPVTVQMPTSFPCYMCDPSDRLIISTYGEIVDKYDICEDQFNYIWKTVD